jgi:hypothetical protein
MKLDLSYCTVFRAIASHCRDMERELAGSHGAPDCWAQQSAPESHPSIKAAV